MSNTTRLLRQPVFWSVIVAIALVAIGDRYPFSHFPMYSKVDGKADILYITNEKDEPLPMRTIFRVGSAQGKKRYENTLKKISGKRDTDRVSDEERRKAGAAFLSALADDAKEKELANYKPVAIRAWLKSVSMESGTFEETLVMLAEHTMPVAAAPAPAPVTVPAP